MATTLRASAALPLRVAIDTAVHRLRHELARVTFWSWGALWHLALTRGQWQPTLAEVRAIDREFRRLIGRDEAAAAAGVYPTRLLRRSAPLPSLGDVPRGVLEMGRVLRRKARGDWRTIPEDASAYPRYYRRTFHWQSDGWLSDRSARLYDTGVEFLFFGCTRPMRRLALPPLVSSLRGRERPRVLDLGCGTGVFLGEVHEALPDARLYGVDLSPYYVRRAREVLAGVPDASLLVEAAESLPFAARTFDAITAVFLLHELPRPVRIAVLREARRLLAPGGVLVVCDSLQKRDAEKLGLARFLEWFPRVYHEPFYRSYVRDPVESLAEACGFRVVSSEAVLFSKVVVARA